MVPVPGVGKGVGVGVVVLETSHAPQVADPQVHVQCAHRPPGPPGLAQTGEYVTSLKNPEAHSPVVG